MQNITTVIMILLILKMKINNSIKSFENSLCKNSKSAAKFPNEDPGPTNSKNEQISYVEM